MAIDREKMFQKYDGHCWYCWCEITMKSMQLDHIIPQRNYKSTILNKYKIPDFLLGLWLDDMNSKDNLMPSCRSCNQYKDTYPLEEFRYQLEQQLTRLNKNCNFKLAKRYWLLQELPQKILFYFEKKTTYMETFEQNLIGRANHRLVKRNLLWEVISTKYLTKEELAEIRHKARSRPIKL